MKILFMGTPDIAVKSLEALISHGHDICAVFTREDKPVGRKQVLTPPPVKVFALEKGIKVYQPKTVKTDEAYQNIQQLNPDLIVVVAYGRILPEVIFNFPKFGTINLHVSLLPKYRGSAPIQRAVLNGDKTTGVSIMYIGEGVDTGDIIKVQSCEIGEDETSEDVFEKVSTIGSKTLLEAIDEMEAGKATRTKQNDNEATPAPPLTKEEALFDFNSDATYVHNLVRGLNPWPIAHFVYDDIKIKVPKTKKYLDIKDQAGKIVKLNPLIVAFENGALELVEVKPDGKSLMSGTAWAMGRRFNVGDFLK